MSDRLNEIEERLAAATPGPWERDQFGPDDDSARFIGSPSTGRIVVYEAATAGNAEFIAHAPADLTALVAVVREVEALHQPNDAPSFTESSYGIAGQIPGTVTLSGFTSRDVTCCRNCGAEYPCPTAQALQRLGGTS